MKRVIVVYGSSTGNTERMAKAVAKGVYAAGAQCRVANVAGIVPEELVGYDLLLLGSSTWGDGDLQDDFVSFAGGMESLCLGGKRAAVFGPGDSSWPRFCGAVDSLEQRLKACGAVLVAEGFKVDGEVEPCLAELESWARKATAEDGE